LRWLRVAERGILVAMGASLRPKFALDVAVPAERLLARLDQQLRAPGCELCGLVTPTRIELQVPPSRKHLWSPELRVEVQAEDTGCRLSGSYGPHPHVWTMFMGIYAALTFAAFLALIFALAQWTLGEPLTALYATPLLALLAAGARALGFVGRGLAKSQIDELRAFLDRAIAQLERPDSVPSRSGVRAAVPTPARDDEAPSAAG